MTPPDESLAKAIRDTPNARDLFAAARAYLADGDARSALVTSALCADVTLAAHPELGLEAVALRDKLMAILAGNERDQHRTRVLN